MSLLIINSWPHIQKMCETMMDISIKNEHTVHVLGSKKLILCQGYLIDQHKTKTELISHFSIKKKKSILYRTKNN